MNHARLSKRHLPIALGLSLALVGCAGTQGGALLSPEGQANLPAAGEQTSELIDLRSNTSASFHVMRLTGSVVSRAFPDHDVTMFVMRGRIRLKLDRSDFSVAQGDVVELPRGTVFALDNAGSAVSLVYFVSTPPLQGAAAQLGAKAPARESAWHWTRWAR